MASITTDGPPFFVKFFPATSIGHLPDGVEDWIATWNTANDCYVPVHLESLENDPDVATDEVLQWVRDFRLKYLGEEIVLVGIDY